MIERAFSERIQKLVDEQGWDDNTVLDLALNFIDSLGPQQKPGPGTPWSSGTTNEQGRMVWTWTTDPKVPTQRDAFIDYLRETQAEENE